MIISKVCTEKNGVCVCGIGLNHACCLEFGTQASFMSLFGICINAFVKFQRKIVYLWLVIALSLQAPYKSLGSSWILYKNEEKPKPMHQCVMCTKYEIGMLVLFFAMYRCTLMHIFMIHSRFLPLNHLFNKSNTCWNRTLSETYVSFSFHRI